MGPVKLRSVSLGDEWVEQVEGGFRRRRTPSAGVVLEVGDREHFISWVDLDATRADVRRRAKSQERRLAVQRGEDDT